MNEDTKHGVEVSALNWSSKGFGSSEDESEVPTKYLFDGGATDAVSNQRYLLLDYKSLPTPIPIKTAANDSNAVVIGKGKIKVDSNEGKKTMIKDVYYCPKATAIIISPGALIAKGAKIMMDGNDYKIRLRNGLTIHAAHKNQGWFIQP